MTTRRSRTLRKTRCTALALMLMCIGGVPAAIAQDYGGQDSVAAQDEGKLLFAKCGACHALAPARNGRGPTLYHLFGRKAGTVPGYGYSPAMERASIVWRDTTLTQFLLNPERVVPGTSMRFAMSANSQQIRALIDYLRAATR